ncbi:hypothetical protein EYF80_058628 [Liparis tanakae]|uniref:Uncharacterized protein n=1 Tax=Liparis tanakae TaxID=230148 RepID=A0A4Z2ERI1_9TELE|nr:hypothetical protein EYF80_058628 [Liparis tanakae]
MGKNVSLRSPQRKEERKRGSRKQEAGSRKQEPEGHELSYRVFSEAGELRLLPAELDEEQSQLLGLHRATEERGGADHDTLMTTR